MSTDLFTLRSDGVDFIDEENSGSVLLAFFERLTQIRFRLTSHLAHNLGT